MSYEVYPVQSPTPLPKKKKTRYFNFQTEIVFFYNKKNRKLYEFGLSPELLYTIRDTNTANVLK